MCVSERVMKLLMVLMARYPLWVFSRRGIVCALWSIDVAHTLRVPSGLKRNW